MTVTHSWLMSRQHACLPFSHAFQSFSKSYLSRAITRYIMCYLWCDHKLCACCARGRAQGKWFRTIPQISFSKRMKVGKHFLFVAHAVSYTAACEQSNLTPVAMTTTAIFTLRHLTRRELKRLAAELQDITVGTTKTGK